MFFHEMETMSPFPGEPNTQPYSNISLHPDNRENEETTPARTVILIPEEDDFGPASPAPTAIENEEDDETSWPRLQRFMQEWAERAGPM